MTTNSKHSFRCPVGAELKFQWPQILGVLSVTSVDQVQTLLKTNPMATVTEKLDGSNLCVSSENWVASRRRVILDNPTEEELKKYKFCGESLSSLSLVFPKLNVLAEEVRKHFPGLELEVLLYGEWIQKVCFNLWIIFHLLTSVSADFVWDAKKKFLASNTLFDHIRY